MTRPRANRVVPTLVLFLVLSPLLLSEGVYGFDWFNHLWLVANQQDAIARGGLPTYWTHTDTVFYPQFVFYGGTLYALTGYLATILGGSTVWAFVLTFVAGFAMAYGGFSWLAHQAGLRGWPVAVPGLVYVTAAYPLSNVYARGAWPEFMATSALPLLIAAAWHLLRTPWRPAPAAALVGATVLFTGAHNITLAWGTAFVIGLLAVAAVAAGRAALARVGVRRFAVVLGLCALGVAINAWFLAPDIAYSSRTATVRTTGGFSVFNHLSLIFDPLRRTPAGSTTGGLDVQAPVLALVWAAVALAVGWSGVLRYGRRLVAGLGFLLVVFLVLVGRDDPALAHIGSPGRWLWDQLPGFLGYVQFAYRLDTYVAMLVCGLVIVALVAAGSVPGRRRLGLQAAIAVVCLISAVQAVVQIWGQPALKGRDAIYSASLRHLPGSWYDPTSFRDRTLPVVDVGPFPRVMKMDAATAAAGGHSRIAVPSGGEPIVTNIVTSTYLVEIPHLLPLGHTPDSHLVVRRAGTTGLDRPLPFVVRPAHTAPLVLGRVITAIAGMVIVIGCLLVALRRRRRRRSALLRRSALRRTRSARARAQRNRAAA